MTGIKDRSTYLGADVFWEGHSYLDFDRRKMRKAMRTVGADIRKIARRKVARRAISLAGEAPGKRTGTLQRSIRYRVSRPGLLVIVRPERTDAMGKDFYPAFLNYGVRRHRSLNAARSHRKQSEGRYKLAPRLNYMEAALNDRKDHAREVLANALTDALVARNQK